MKHLVLTIILALFSSTLFAAEAGVFYNPDRDGEGATVFTDGSSLALFFYTYRDEVVIRPPEVSPSYPLPGPELVCVNEPIWYLLQADDYDGQSASGNAYTGIAFSYPYPVGKNLSDVQQIGTFFLNRDQDGFDLMIDWVENDVVSPYVSLYDSVYQLWTPLASISTEE